MTTMKKTLRALMWLITGSIVLLSVLPVALLPFVTGVPLLMALLLALFDVGLLIVMFGDAPSDFTRAGAVLGFVVVAALAVILSQAYATTPPIVGADGEPLPDGIATLEQVELNGSRQWITIRGEDVDNPVLLFLAGGPGGSELPSTRKHLGELEEHFVVVNWDQPGAGKSYDAVEIEALTPERYVEDGYALTEYLCERFDEEKIYVLGESWGTILGIWLIEAHPEHFHAYAGSGQMVKTTENDVLGYELALGLAREREDTATLERLRENGPPPYIEGNVALKYNAFLNYLNGYMAERAPGEGEQGDIALDMLTAPEYGLLDKVRWVLGLMETFSVVYPQLEEVDLTSQAADLEVPVYFLEGRHDVNAMTSLVEAYHATLDAPHKEIIWFEKSGHTPLYEQSETFVEVLVNRVLGDRR